MSVIALECIRNVSCRVTIPGGLFSAVRGPSLFGTPGILLVPVGNKRILVLETCVNYVEPWSCMMFKLKSDEEFRTRGW